MNTHILQSMNNWQRTRLRRRTIAAVTATALLAVACAGTTVFGGRVGFDGAGVYFGHYPDGTPTFTVPPLPPGQCATVRVRNGGGQLISVLTCPGGSTHPIPVGAVAGIWETGDCPQEFFAGKNTENDASRDDAVSVRAAGGLRAPIDAEQVVELRGVPFAIDTVDGGRYKNALYHFRVSVPRGRDAFSIIEPILLGGPGTPVPNNVEIISFTQVIPDPQGVRLIAADTDAFDTFRLDWNGQIGYADLAFDINTNHYQVNGWDVVESLILGADIHTVGSPNDGITTRKTVTDASAHVVDAQLIVN